MPAKPAAIKPAAEKKPAVKPVALQVARPKKTVVAPKMVAGAVVDDSPEGKAAVALRIKDLVDRVTASGDFKKKDVRDIVEATLAELARALEQGATLNLPPFGKLRVGHSRELANGSMMTLKLRRIPAKTAGGIPATQGLADADEAG